MVNGHDLHWMSPRAPEPPAGRGSHKVITRAFLTASQIGPLEVSDGRRHQWHVGAVYTSDGLLERESRRHGALFGDLLRSLDQESTDPTAVGEELPGAWYYGGTWFEMFGHFIVETLPHLWLHDGQLPVIWHRHGDPPIHAFQRELLKLAGVEGEPRFATTATVVERLVVPARPVAMNSWIAPQAQLVWQRVASRVKAAEPHRRVFLSRRQYEENHAADRRREESFLDEVFASLGFEVWSPESLSPSEQIRLIRESLLIAGVEGSALHLTAFARPGTHVMMLGSSRAWKGNRVQPLIDGVNGNKLAIIPYLNERREHATIRAMISGVLAKI